MPGIMAAMGHDDGGLKSKGLKALRQKSWQLITLNRFFEKSKERQALSIDKDTHSHLPDVRAELADLSTDPKFQSGFHAHKFASGDEYAGDWKGGSMSGKGVFKYSNGNEYAGYWENNQRNGQGTFRNKQTGTKYEGNWEQDKRSGRGRFTDKEGNYYEGEWVNNDMEGQGTYTFVNGDQYIGLFQSNDFNGPGKFTYANKDYYEGEWQDGQCHGRGKFIYPEIDHAYDGDWVKDRKEGKGKYTAPDYIYEGGWKDDAMSGKGTYTYPNGDKYVGDWLDNEEHGKGVFSHSDGSKYEGSFRKGKRAGHGKFTSADGSKYEGEWEDNVKAGQGTYTYPTGDQYSGDWAEDVMHGSGTYTYKSGKRFRVKYEYGKNVEKQRIKDAEAPAPPPVEKPSRSVSPAVDRPITPNPANTNEEKVAQFLNRAKGTAALLMTAVDNPTTAKPTIAEQARSDMQQSLQFMSLPNVNQDYRQTLSEMSDQFAELLQMWDESQREHQRDTLPKIDNSEKEKEEERKKKEAEDRMKKQEEDRESMKKRMEDLKAKRTEKDEMKELQKKLEAQEKEKNQLLEGEDDQEKEYEEQIKQQKADMVKLKRDLAQLQKPNPVFDAIKQQIAAEKRARMDGETAAAEAEVRERLRASVEERTKAAEAAKYAAEQAAEERVENYKKQLEEEMEEKVHAYKIEYEEKNKQPDGKEEIELMNRKEHEAEIQEMEARLKAMTAGPDKPMATPAQMEEVKKIKDLYEKEMQTRRKLYNELAGLKGSVRVYVRIKPEGTEGKDSLAVPNDEMLTVVGDKKKSTFEFEKIFASFVTNDGVYADVSPMVSGVLEGSNVAVLTYGPRGSGKTYTMLGQGQPGGIMQRSVLDLMKMVQDRAERDKIEMFIGVIQLQGENASDLQRPANSNLKVSTDAEKGDILQDLTYTEVHTGREASQLIERAASARDGASSFLVSILVHVENLQHGTKTWAKCTLGDLCSAKSDHALESMGNCFNALSKKGTPSYNNSLCSICKDGFEGKTLLICTVSDAHEKQGEAVETIMFGLKAKGEEDKQTGKKKK